MESNFHLTEFIYDGRPAYLGRLTLFSMSSLAQWIERSPGVREGMCSIPVENSEFFF